MSNQTSNSLSSEKTLFEYRFLQRMYVHILKDLALNTWYEIRSLALPLSFGRAGIPLNEEETEWTGWLIKTIISYDLLMDWDLQLVFSNDYTKFKKYYYTFNKGQTLYEKRILKERKAKNESNEK